MKKATRTDNSRPRRRWLKWLKRIATLAFFVLVAVLLFSLARNVDWHEVIETLRGYSPLMLVAGVGITAVSYLVFSSYDLLGKKYTGHGLSTGRVLLVAFVCYAFNLNLGAWVGGLAMRYRLYTRLGLGVGIVTRILSISLIANWLGYMILAGAIFSFRLLELPQNWEIGATGLQFIGFGLLAVAFAYLTACRFSKRRVWHIRGHEIVLPPLRLALMQAALGAANWSLMAALIYLLLPQGLFFPSILGILLISSIAGVITHIPGGLGVLEAVFLALLQHHVAPSQILAALIGYRALYFLLPLTVAFLVYLLLERRGRKRKRAQARQEG
ncbi:lysylphosphatidylglycerol synthase domain-containing protein [Halomonas sp. LR3S48]|uniref:lysylphosphatidylglycerol synthase domain-containing protein n=1 Tax=Halomonas sp. LR3S48 TaxID=2982694 RepID=UPI0021E3F901|nr:lysylphosphatidylglycerol synthase domain-containing protein [Halomonas sp. LR3S48]UYG03053.1 lysylphosphatidylglycerol synthase domain-containing protein [Halomonas sp. LR3S48]